MYPINRVKTRCPLKAAIPTNPASIIDKLVELNKNLKSELLEGLKAKWKEQRLVMQNFKRNWENNNDGYKDFRCKIDEVVLGFAEEFGCNKVKLQDKLKEVDEATINSLFDDWDK